MTKLTTKDFVLKQDTKETFKTPQKSCGKVQDYVMRLDTPTNKFVYGREYIISTRDYIFFNRYNRFILNLPVMHTYVDSKEVLHIIC